jgi:hypothetical protein
MADNAQKEKIDSAIKFWDKVIKEPSVEIKFVKKDGTIRYMKCTLNFTKIPEEKRPKGVNVANILKLMQSKGIIHVFDLEKQEWRSVPFDSVEWLKTRTQLYKIREMRGMME